MAQLKNIKKWFWWHRWTSLICTIFLLMLCITGLPLIFADEINEWQHPAHYRQLPENTPMADIDKMIDTSKAKYPSQQITSVFIDDDEPQVVISMSPTFKPDNKLMHSLQFDQRTGELLKDLPPYSRQPKTFIGLMLQLHTNLFMDLPGELFLGCMGVLFIISVISGIVLYGPFMRKLNFGTVRLSRSKRFKWLDLHNLLGIAVAAWLLIAGITGVMNELSTPLFGIWQQTDVKSILNKYKLLPSINNNNLSSAQKAYNTVKKHMPGMSVISIIFPGNVFGSPYHYVLWTKGKQPFTSRIFNPVLVDANTGEFTTIVKMPFYLRALEISRPLHFGDYGKTPLKIIWAIMDLIAIAILISGIYLWVIRKKIYENYFKNLEIEIDEKRN